MGKGPLDTLDNAPTEDGRGQEGNLLADRYRIVRKLGEGGMGMVYLAEDIELANHKVAIKFIPPMLAGNARAVKNLQREALTAMQLTHPNIVRLHDLHTDGHQKFLVMEYVAGKTLDDLLAEREGERIPLDELLPIAEQTAGALDYAHSQNVLHRDLKPSNLMVADDGTVRLLDFGIAREMKDSYTRVTGQETSGTLPYMSPEQLMGEKPSAAMDVYSFGAVLYECLAGHPPFHMGDIREQIKTKAPRPIENVAPQVNEALLSALSKDPARRPRSAGDLVARLKNPPDMPDRSGQDGKERIDVDSPNVSRFVEPSCQPVATAPPKRSYGWLVALIVLTCVVGGIVFFGVLNMHGQRSAPELVYAPPSGVGEEPTPAPGAAPDSMPTDQPNKDAGTEQGKPQEVRGPVAGEAWTVPDLNMAFVYVAPGNFQMGSGSGTRDEQPVHTVQISRGFWMGTSEATNGQYQRFVKETGYDGSRESDADYLRHHGDWGLSASPEENYPIVCVSWSNAAAFCRWLTESERKAGRLPDGYVYRLPTEAEWEYAARGGSTSWGFEYAGSNTLDDVAWYASNSGGKTHPVGQKRPNELGLYDMSGNVWEWCHDWYGEDYYGESPSADPAGLSSGSGRVLRGGAWSYDPQNCRSSVRARSIPVLANDRVGFRVVLSFPLDPSVVQEASPETRSESRPTQQGLQSAGGFPPDLLAVVGEPFPSLDGLDFGSWEAQDRQRRAITELGLPLDVRTARTGIPFRLIPAGSFTMGSRVNEWGLQGNETQHQVTLTKPFYCGKYEVTQGQWEMVMGSNPSSFENAGRDAPVETVSWEDCQVFLERLCQTEGVPEGTYRLLTEAEWEYACRAGSAARYCSGDSDSSLGEYAWYGANSGGSVHPVGQKRPNGWGLYDMHGNVWEWCQDWCAEYSSGDVMDPLGPPSGILRVPRGGSWGQQAGMCESAFHGGSLPISRNNDLGFRLARIAPSYP